MWGILKKFAPQQKYPLPTPPPPPAVYGKHNECSLKAQEIIIVNNIGDKLSSPQSWVFDMFTKFIQSIKNSTHWKV